MSSPTSPKQSSPTKADFHTIIDRPTTPQVQSPTVGITAYVLIGQHDAIDGEGNPIVYTDTADKVCAKRVVHEDNTYYYVKRRRDGSFFNPIGLYGEDRRSKRYKYANNTEWKLRPVSFVVFDFYVKFLQTRNVAWLRNAEREAI